MCWAHACCNIDSQLECNWQNYRNMRRIKKMNHTVPQLAEVFNKTADKNPETHFFFRILNVSVVMRDDKIEQMCILGKLADNNIWFMVFRAQDYAERDEIEDGSTV